MMKKAISFDLSSVMIGVCFALIGDDKKIKRLEVMPVIPRKANGKDFGYTTKNKKVVELRDGSKVRTFLKEGEVIVTKKEARRRNADFKDRSSTFLLTDIGRQLGTIMQALEPDIILVERNETFGGILTTKLLAEITGGLFFWAGANGVEIKKYNAQKMRSLLNREVRGIDLVNEKGEKIVDTKQIVKLKLTEYYRRLGIEEIGGWSEATLDESDALMVMTYYYIKEVLNDGGGIT